MSTGPSVANGGFNNSPERLSPDAAVDAIANWLRANTISRNVSASDMKVLDFARRCEQIGCSVKTNQDGATLITSERDSVRISGDTRQINGSVAKRYLNVLGLSLQKTGQTFAEFQNVDDTERQELRRYIVVLRRLAKI
ncbi:MAG: hypothetical protein WAO78_11710 [Roseovarius sp.]